MGYYDPPSDKVFAEIKSAAIDIWQSYIVGMFDSTNQAKLFASLSPEAQTKMLERYQDV